jgi:hypothetical protein
LTVNVKAAEPAVTLVGLIEVTAGAGVLFPPPPDPPEPDPPPPQPLIRTEIPRPNNKPEKPGERNHDRGSEHTLTKEPLSP